jgi:signal transduction histidine kinase
MNLYMLMPLAACLACSMLAVAVLARDSTRRASLLAAGVAFCGAWWAGLEVIWTGADDPRIAVQLIRLSAPGWMFIGPVILHLFLELTSHPGLARRWVLPALYGMPTLTTLIDVGTPWIHPSVQPAPWGWSYTVTPLFLLPYINSSATVAIGLWIGAQRALDWGPPAHRRLWTWMYIGLAIPLVIASISDGLAPLVGWQLPRFGAASTTVMVASVAWTFRRYGYSLLAPGAFATEILATLREGVALLRMDGQIHSVNNGMARLADVAPRVLEGTDIGRWLDAELPAPDSPEQECGLARPGAETIAVSVRTSLLHDKQQNPIGLVLVVRDRREIESLRSRLITSGRLASVGQLAAGIAHEINNPVAYVRANLGALSSILEELRKSQDPNADIAEGQELISESLDGVDRVASIVRDVKGFSHAGGGGAEVIEVHRLLESVLRVAGPQLRYAGAIHRDFSEVPPLRGSSQQLKQVFLNLVINASQAVEERQEIRVATYPREDDPTRVVIEVSDEGCGIPAEQLDRIFDPFFTTKPVGEGTGLGLSISYEIVKGHGGELSVESSPGRGTCFRVELPAADLDADDPEEAPSA